MLRDIERMSTRGIRGRLRHRGARERNVRRVTWCVDLLLGLIECGSACRLATRAGVHPQVVGGQIVEELFPCATGPGGAYAAARRRRARVLAGETLAGPESCAYMCPRS